MTSARGFGRSPRLTMAAGLTIAGLVLGACSSEGSSDQGDADTPQAGGTLTFAVLSDAGCADPQQVTSLDAGYWARQTVDSLTDQDPKTGEVVPWLASSWDINEDATEFTFTLRDDATFSDGTAIDADAVKDNFDTLLDLGPRASTGTGYLDGYTGSTVVDDSTVTISFDEPNAQFLQATSTFQLGLVAPASLEKSADDRCAGVITSGPFTTKEYVEGQSITLEKRPGYAWPSTLWNNEGEAYLDSLVFKVVGESSVRTGGLQSGELDGIAGVTPQDVPLVEGAGAEVLLRTNPGIGFNLAANNSAPVISDPAVRRALSQSIDRQEIADVNYAEGTLPATSIVSSTTPGHLDLGDELSFDVDAAEKTLDDAGWTKGSDGVHTKDGEKLSLDVVWTNGAVGNKTLLELVQQQAKAAGIDLVLKEQDQAAFVDSLNGGLFDLILTTTTRADADVLRTTYSSKLTNTFKVPATDLDQLLDEQAAEADPAARQKLIEQAQQEIVGQLYGIPLVELTTVVGLSKDLHDVSLDATSRLRLQDAWKS